MTTRPIECLSNEIFRVPISLRNDGERSLKKISISLDTATHSIIVVPAGHKEESSKKNPTYLLTPLLDAHGNLNTELICYVAPILTGSDSFVRLTVHVSGIEDVEEGIFEDVIGLRFKELVWETRRPLEFQVGSDVVGFYSNYPLTMLVTLRNRSPGSISLKKLYREGLHPEPITGS
jgi:hypothetical protein